MNYLSNVLVQKQPVGTKLVNAIELEKQVIELSEWKQKAMVQLEHFKTACILYNFCDLHELNRLLNAKNGSTEI